MRLGSVQSLTQLHRRASRTREPALLACCLAALMATGCGRPAGMIFEPLETPLVWPQPPDPARIHYIGSLSTDRDLKPARTLPETLGAALFGRSEPRAMVSPMAVTIADDRLFVADSNAQCIHMFDLDTRRYERWTGSRDHQPLVQPVGIAFDATPPGRILVADSAAGGLYAFDLRGRGLGWLGGEHLLRPSGITTDEAPTGEFRLLIADPGLHQVVVLDGQGTLITAVGTRGTAGGEFNFPTSITAGAGHIFVSDSLNFRVQVFAWRRGEQGGESTLEFVRQIGRHGKTVGHFSQPKGVTVDRHGHIYVVDSHFEAVQIFNTTGQLLLSFGREGRSAGEFWLPGGIFASTDDRIWVADTHNRRVQVFEYRDPAVSAPEGDEALHQQAEGLP